MQAILAQDVDGLGKAGAVVNVTRGYLRNYLVPRNLAEVATPAKIAEAERRIAAEQAAIEKRIAEAADIAALLGPSSRSRPRPAATAARLDHVPGRVGRQQGRRQSRSIVTTSRSALHPPDGHLHHPGGGRTRRQG